SKSGLEIGATVTLRELIDTFKEAAEKVTRLAHLDRISDHYQQVANQAVRANASWAGNLMMKHRHQDFPSDVFITLEAAKTVIKVADEQGTQDHVLTDFLRLDMRGKVIVSAKLPAISTDQHFYRSFKITPRQLNAHAYVNGAFELAVDKKKDYTVLERPTIVIGGISDKFNRATKTENFLLNKS
ncbi:hypothetical protein BOX15_Mlig032303g2, partial [Macrostomum lignano]